MPLGSYREHGVWGRCGGGLPRPLSSHILLPWQACQKDLDQVAVQARQQEPNTACWNGHSTPAACRSATRIGYVRITSASEMAEDQDPSGTACPGGHVRS